MIVKVNFKFEIGQEIIVKGYNGACNIFARRMIESKFNSIEIIEYQLNENPAGCLSDWIPERHLDIYTPKPEPEPEFKWPRDLRCFLPRVMVTEKNLFDYHNALMEYLDKRFVRK